MEIQPILITTDNSKLYLADESDLIGNLVSITNLIDSTQAQEEQQQKP